jgi:copper chaperone CopZ
MLLEGMEDDLTGVESVEANLKNQELTVTFDELVTEEEAVKAAALKEGYELISKDTK